MVLWFELHEGKNERLTRVFSVSGTGWIESDFT